MTEHDFSGAFFSAGDFEGSDSQRINRAVAAAAAAGGGRVLVPRENRRGGESRPCWLLDEAVILRENITLLLDDCHLKLSDRCRDNFIRAVAPKDGRPWRRIAVCGRGRPVLEGADRPRATGDAAKTLGERTYGTDAGVSGENQNGDRRNIGILLAGIEDFRLENLFIRDSHGWAVSLEYCARGLVRDLEFSSTGEKIIDGRRQVILNQDGLDLRRGCREILIENISGRTGDDTIALTAMKGRASAAGAPGNMFSEPAFGDDRDDISHIVIRGVRAWTRHHIVRLLNSDRVRLHDVIISDLLDTSPESGPRPKAAVKIGDHAYGSGPAPLGDTARITISNLITRAQHPVFIGGSLCAAAISNVIHRGPAGATVPSFGPRSGPEFVRDLAVCGVIAADTKGE